ncbi:MAG: AAA family ATPase [Planctomycetaceae bacterium]|jgi:capsular exopolysaccharide synthesis family protein|nr:AAA family ATPase [Planctomycetaceae bacterium]
MSNNIAMTDANMPVGPDPMGGDVMGGDAGYDGQYPHQPPRMKASIDSTETSKMNPHILILMLLSGFKRSWKWALPTGIITGLIAAVCLYVTFPVKYEAKAWLRISYEKPYYVYNDKATQSYDQFVQTQFMLIKSPLILKRVLDQPSVTRSPEVLKQRDQVQWLSNKLVLRSENKSELITISIQMEDPRQAEIIVNSVVDAFMANNSSDTNNWHTKLLNQLQIEINRQQAEAKLAQSQINRSLRRAAEAGASQTGGENRSGFKVEDSIQRDVYLAEGELVRISTQMKTIEQMLSDPTMTAPDAVVEAAIVQDPLLQQLTMERQQLEEQKELDQYKNLPPTDRRLVKINNQITALTDRINKYILKLQDLKPQELNSMRRQNLEIQLDEKRMAVLSQERLVETLRKRRDEQSTNTTRAVVDLSDVNFRQAELQRINAVLDQLATRMVTLQTESTAPNRISICEKAATPRQPNNAQMVSFVGMGAIGCFCFPFFIGIAAERMRPRLYHTSQIRAAISNVLIGEIMEPPVSWIHGATFRKRLARYRESVHSWCTHLLLSHPFNMCRTLAVASVAGDDGKTFLAIQVAVAMAQMKSGPVLLIDGDMRVGRLHLLFGNEEPGIGLADVLSFQKGIGEAIVQNEKEPNLHLLSSGNLDVSPYELLGDGRFRELLDMLESHYSLVMVVLPPVANAAESLVMAQSVDSVLLCVRQGETVLAAMEDVFRKLINTGSNVDGVVVKDIPYSQMAGKDGGFQDKVEQIRLAHLLQYSD